MFGFIVLSPSLFGVTGTFDDAFDASQARDVALEQGINIAGSVATLRPCVEFAMSRSGLRQPLPIAAAGIPFQSAHRIDSTSEIAVTFNASAW
ncbi:MAG TPA: hypothetical protein VLB06_07925 [Sulfuricaulis sp.]|nr:hypothetical protein [Sulfuricaulis sp.]